MTDYVNCPMWGEDPPETKLTRFSCEILVNQEEYRIYLETNLEDDDFYEFRAFKKTLTEKQLSKLINRLCEEVQKL